MWYGIGDMRWYTIYAITCNLSISYMLNLDAIFKGSVFLWFEFESLFRRTTCLRRRPITLTQFTTLIYFKSITIGWNCAVYTQSNLKRMKLCQQTIYQSIIRSILLYSPPPLGNVKALNMMDSQVAKEEVQI